MLSIVLDNYCIIIVLERHPDHLSLKGRKSVLTHLVAVLTECCDGCASVPVHVVEAVCGAVTYMLGY